MPTGPRILLDNACYHVVMRGNQRQMVFMEKSDFEYYLNKIRKYKRKYNLFLYSYCLMSNHIHMLVEIKDSKNLPSFMHDLNRSYTAYFNNRYQKVGYLWQGRFKSYIVNKDEYVFNCINYMESNPVRAELVDCINEYKYSSYNERVLGIVDRYKMLDNFVI